VRDDRAYEELTHVAPCILFLHFTEAFDRISQTYLFRMLQSYRYSTRFIALINAMCGQAFFSVLINGHLAGPFPVRCFVRESCPMNLLLFTLTLNPLLCLLEHNITGIGIGHKTKKTAIRGTRRCHDFCDCATRHKHNQSGTSYLNTKGRRVLV
jgi:hypothetical protein